MSLDEARQWERTLEHDLAQYERNAIPGYPSPAHKRAQWDLEDVRERIAQLS